MQAQQFVLSLKQMQALNEYEEHVKTYRPRILVFSGIPGHRQPLVDFANLLTKKLSLLICADVRPVSMINVAYLAKQDRSLIQFFIFSICLAF